MYILSCVEVPVVQHTTGLANPLSIAEFEFLIDRTALATSLAGWLKPGDFD